MTSRVSALVRYLDVMDYFKRWDGFTGEEAAELFTIFKRRGRCGGSVGRDEEQPSPDKIDKIREGKNSFCDLFIGFVTCLK